MGFDKRYTGKYCVDASHYNNIKNSQANDAQNYILCTKTCNKCFHGKTDAKYIDSSYHPDNIVGAKIKKRKSIYFGNFNKSKPKQFDKSSVIGKIYHTDTRVQTEKLPKTKYKKEHTIVVNPQKNKQDENIQVIEDVFAEGPKQQHDICRTGECTESNIKNKNRTSFCKCKKKKSKTPCPCKSIYGEKNAKRRKLRYRIACFCHKYKSKTAQCGCDAKVFKNEDAKNQALSNGFCACKKYTTLDELNGKTNTQEMHSEKEQRLLRNEKVDILRKGNKFTSLKNWRSKEDQYNQTTQKGQQPEESPEDVLLKAEVTRARSTLSLTGMRNAFTNYKKKRKHMKDRNQATEQNTGVNSSNIAEISKLQKNNLHSQSVSTKHVKGEKDENDNEVIKVDLLQKDNTLKIFDNWRRKRNQNKEITKIKENSEEDNKLIKREDKRTRSTLSLTSMRNAFTNYKKKKKPMKEQKQSSKKNTGVNSSNISKTSKLQEKIPHSQSFSDKHYKGRKDENDNGITKEYESLQENKIPPTCECQNKCALLHSKESYVAHNKKSLPCSCTNKCVRLNNTIKNTSIKRDTLQPIKENLSISDDAKAELAKVMPAELGLLNNRKVNNHKHKRKSSTIRSKNSQNEEYFEQNLITVWSISTQTDFCEPDCPETCYIGDVIREHRIEKEIRANQFPRNVAEQTESTHKCNEITCGLKTDQGRDYMPIKSRLPVLELKLNKETMCIEDPDGLQYKIDKLIKFRQTPKNKLCLYGICEAASAGKREYICECGGQVNESSKARKSNSLQRLSRITGYLSNICKKKKQVRRTRTDFDTTQQIQKVVSKISNLNQNLKIHRERRQLRSSSEKHRRSNLKLNKGKTQEEEDKEAGSSNEKHKRLNFKFHKGKKQVEEEQEAGLKVNKEKVVMEVEKEPALEEKLLQGFHSLRSKYMEPKKKTPLMLQKERQRLKAKRRKLKMRRKAMEEEYKKYKLDLKRKDKEAKKVKELQYQIGKKKIKELKQERNIRPTNVLADFFVGLFAIGFSAGKIIVKILYKVITDPGRCFLYIRARASDPEGTIHRLSLWWSIAWQRQKFRMNKSIKGSEKMTIIADHVQDSEVYQAFANKGTTAREKELIQQQATRRKKRMLLREKEAKGNCRHILLLTLKNTPCLWVYHVCPSLYPQCLSLLRFWRHFSELILFCLAFLLWTPCIGCFELCRGLTCCLFCTQ